MEKTATAALKLRQLAGNTQAQAAGLIGVSVRTWQSWEQGIRDMPSSKKAYFLWKSNANVHWMLLNAKKKRV